MDQLNKIADEITQIRIDLAKISVTLAVNTEDVKEHIRRTNLLEESVNRLSVPYTVGKYLVACAGAAYAILRVIDFLHLH